MSILQHLGLTAERPTLPRLQTNIDELALEGWYDWWEFTTPDGYLTRVYAEYIGPHYQVQSVRRVREAKG